MKNLIYIILLLCVSISINAQQIGKSTYGAFALTNAKIVTFNNDIVEGTLMINDGRISSVGADVNIPVDATVIDCEGKFIYPGMIDAGTTLGLNEIGAVSLTQDANEIGDLTPHMEALTAVNPNSVLIPVTRVNGVTTVLTNPTGGRFPGRAALINLHGYTPQQMYAGFKGQTMNFPSSGRRGRWDRRSDEDRKKQEEKNLKSLKTVWDQLQLYQQVKNNLESGDRLNYNPELEALLPVFEGKEKLIINVNKKADILSAIKWVQDNKIDAIFAGVSDGWRVAEELAAANIPVITGPVLNYPSKNSDKYDRPYANAGLMHKAGVKVAIRTNETENVRNLPFNAGFAAAYGLGKEQALKAVTIVPAEIFGLDKEIGSIEVGKQANIFVCDGDPFETKTTITHLFINGWNVPMESRHTYLYDEFLDRSPGLKN